MPDFDLSSRERAKKPLVEFYARNPGGTEFKFKPVSWEGSWPKIGADLEPREMEIECLRKVPVNQSSIVRAVYAGKTIFRGYVEYLPEINGSKKTVVCAGVEKLLDSVVCPNYFYTSGDVNLDTIFANDLADNVLPGLFAIGNSHLPHGWPYTTIDGTLQVIKLAGMGTSSRWGDNKIFSCGLYSAIQISEELILSNLDVIDRTFFRDVDDLYVRIAEVGSGRGWYSRGGLLLANGFDTTCRSGIIDGGTSALWGDLEINIETKLGSLMVNLAKGHDIYVHIRDDTAHTYFDILDDMGRGEEDGIFNLYEADCTGFRRLAAKDPRCSSLTGKGVGYLYYTARDMTYPGVWVGKTYDVENGFKDAAGFLTSYTEDEFEIGQLDYQWEVGTYKRIDIGSGDFVRLLPRGELSEILSCEKIIRSSTGETVLTLGAPRPRFVDSWEALKDITRGFTDKTVWKTSISNTQSTTCYPYDPAHTGTEAFLTYAVPDNVLATELNPRITLVPSLSYDSLAAIPISQRCVFLVTVNGIDTLPINNITIGSNLLAIDITNYITQGVNNEIHYKVYFAKECQGTHSSYSGHPLLSVSGTINYYKRLGIT
jgi:hypothetical protein